MAEVGERPPERVELLSLLLHPVLVLDLQDLELTAGQIVGVAGAGCGRSRGHTKREAMRISSGQTVAGFALVKLGSDGQLNVLNVGGYADYLVDVAGFIRGP